MMNAIQKIVKERLLPDVYKDLVVRYSGVQEDLILYGAATVAIDRILEKTDIFFN